MIKESEVHTNARLLIKCIENELRLGTKHWDQDDNLLETPKAILFALTRGPITIEPTEARKDVFKGY